MPHDEGIPPDAGEVEAKLKIAKGLKACHDIVADYRTKFGVANGEQLVDEHPANDDDPIDEESDRGGPE
jgi:hypothetical protein